MGIWILFIIVFLLMGVLLYDIAYEYTLSTFLFNVALGSISWIFILGFVYMITTEVVDYKEIEKPTTVIELSALKDGSSSSGNFFLGTGTIDSSQYYFYLTQNSKGLQQSKLKIDSDVYLKEDDSVKPNISKYNKVTDSKFVKFMFGEQLTVESHTIITVPANSVTTEFKVDLE